MKGAETKVLVPSYMIILERVPKSRPDVHFTNNARWSVTMLRLFAPVALALAALAA